MNGYLLPDTSAKSARKYLKDLPLMNLSFPFLKFVPNKLEDEATLTEALRKSHINATAREFRAWVLEWTFVFAVVSVAGVAIGMFLLHTVFIIAIMAMPAIFYMIGKDLPYSWQKSVGKQFSGVNFITFLSLFNVYVASGVRLDEIFEKIGESDRFKAISQESQRIVNDVRNFGMDIMTAMQESAKYSPSEKWSNFLGGIVSAAKSGSNIAAYVNAETAHATLEWDRDVEKLTESLNIFSEIYTTVGNAFPLFLVFIMGIMSVLGGTGSAGAMFTLLLAIVMPAGLSGVFTYIFSSTVREGFK